METNAKRKDIIKNITIIFLIIMLVLTFFSSTIMNRSLPEVAAQYAYSGQITTSVRANGTTTANENYQVILEEGRVIHSVEVRRGDKVKEGDLLFTLEEGDSTELQEAQDALAKAELDYEKWKHQTQAEIADAELEIRYETEDLARIKSRGIMSTLDTSEQEKAIRELEKKIASYKRVDAMLVMEAAEAAMNTAETEMKKAKADMDAMAAAQKTVAAALKNAQKDLTEKTEAYNELKGSSTSVSTEQLQQQLLSAERGIEDQTIELQRLQKQYEDLTAENEARIEQRKTLETALKNAQTIYDMCVGEESSCQSNIAFYQSIIGRLSALPELTEEEVLELAAARGNLSFYQSLLSNAMSDQSDALAELNEAKSKYNANESAISQAEDQLASMTQTLEDKTRTLDRAKSDRDAIIRRIDEILALPSEAEQNAVIDAAKDVMETAEDARDAAQEASEQAQDDYNAARTVYETAKSAYETAKSAYGSTKSAYEIAKQNGKSISGTYTRKQIEGLIANTELELENAREALEQLKNTGSTNTDGYSNYNAYTEAVTAQQRTIEGKKKALERKKEEIALIEPTYTESIARAKQTVERISETEGSNEIYAKVSGTINNIAVSAGQEIKSQTLLAEIEQTDRGYTVELTMTAEQAKRVAVGQAATVLYYWGTTPEAVVESIKPSQSDPQNTRIVTLLVSGDITAGQSFTFSLGERSANYDNVVPSSAIREDSNGKFVLVVEAKNTPIGNRYTAVRRDVEVIAEDDTNTAVTGLTGGEFVITTSQTPISAGQQIRLSDN